MISLDTNEWLATEIVSAYMSEAMRGEVRSDCPPEAELVDYASNRSALDLSKHMLTCTPCRRKIAAIRLAEVSAPDGTKWRLRHAKWLKAAGMEIGSDIAERLSGFLASIGQARPEPKRTYGLLRQDGTRLTPESDVATIDSQGRLVCEIRFATSAEWTGTVTLAMGSRQLELFNIAALGDRILALVDLSAFASGETMELDWTRAGGRVECAGPEPKPKPTEPLSTPGDLELAFTDALLEAPHSSLLTTAESPKALQSKADKLANLIAAWSNGNNGEVPQPLLDRYASISMQQIALGGIADSSGREPENGGLMISGALDSVNDNGELA